MYSVLGMIYSIALVTGPLFGWSKLAFAPNVYGFLVQVFLRYLLVRASHRHGGFPEEVLMMAHGHGGIEYVDYGQDYSVRST